MKYFSAALMVSFLAISTASTAQVVNWTISIDKIYVGNDTAKVFIKNAIAPNPSSASWNCTSHLVSLGDYKNPIPTSLKYSTAMEAYKSGATARIGVEGSGAHCVLTYITLNAKT